MSTENGVYVGVLNIAYGRAEYYLDCAPLFLNPEQRGRLCWDTNSDEEFNCVIEKVSIIKKRLDLMGYTLPKCKEKYEECLKFDNDFMNFEDFYKMLRSVKITADYYSHDAVKDCPNPIEQWDYISHVKYISKTKYNLGIDYDSFSECSDAYYHLDRFVVIRLFCEIHQESGLYLSWDILNTIEAGYYSESDVFHGVSSNQKITIITEGNTDAIILRKAIDSYYSDFKDFFIVIYKDDFPFSSGSKITELFMGLAKLNVNSRILFMYDNDIAGNNEIKKLENIEHGKNLMYTTLPTLNVLENVLFKGPSGDYHTNANGNSSSIECFLDFEPIANNPSFRAKSYDESVDAYQGVIEQKKQLNNHLNDIGKPNYDSGKLRLLLDFIYDLLCQF